MESRVFKTYLETIKVQDMVNSPEHYTSGDIKCPNCDHPIECIDIIENFNALRANAIKYLWRGDYKGKTIEDLKKAIFYITREISRLEKKECCQSMKSWLEVQDGTNLTISPLLLAGTILTVLH